VTLKLCRKILSRLLELKKGFDYQSVLDRVQQIIDQTSPERQKTIFLKSRRRVKQQKRLPQNWVFRQAL